MRGTIEGMAGRDGDIERLLAEMNALNDQAEQALRGDQGAAVQKRPATEPARTKQGKEPREGLPPAVLRALVVSGVAAALVWVLFLVLPFVGLGIWDTLAAFGAALLVAAFYTVRGRGRE